MKTRFYSLWLALILFAVTACQAQVVTQVVEVTKEVQVSQNQIVLGTQVVEVTEGEAARVAGGAPVESFATQLPLAALAADAGKVDVVGTPSPLTFSAPGSGLVIKDAELGLVVQDVDSSVNRLTQLVADYGGYIINSEVVVNENFKTAYIRLAVPVQNFERALNDVRRLAVQVERERASGQDVSAEYTDLQSRLTNLEVTAARVREFLKDAKTVEESLRISGQLSELEQQIEQVKGQMRYYEGRAAFSTMTVSLRPPFNTPTPSPTPTPTNTPTATPTATPTPGWQPSATVQQASNVLTNILQIVADMLIWVVIVGGPFIVAGAVLFGLWRFLRRSARKP